MMGSIATSSVTQDLNALNSSLTLSCGNLKMSIKYISGCLCFGKKVAINVNNITEPVPIRCVGGLKAYL